MKYSSFIETCFFTSSLLLFFIIHVSNSFTASSVRRPSFLVDPTTIQSKKTSFHHPRSSSSSLILILYSNKVGVFYGTSTGNTESVAYMIVDELGDEIAQGPFVVDDILGSVASKFQEYDILMVGTPTWNTGADTERSGTTWDELYYGEMQELKLNGKKVAVFGLGDQLSYKDNYADATGELHDVFQGLGAQMYGYTSQTGYKHKASKSIRGDKFCGLLCDNVNQEELTEDRVKNWIVQLKSEGFFDSGTTTTRSTTPAVTIPTVVESKPKELIALEQQSHMFQSTLSSSGHDEATKVTTTASSNTQQALTFNPHFNAKTGVTMWVSTDGRKCFYTSGKP